MKDWRSSFQLFMFISHVVVFLLDAKTTHCEVGVPNLLVSMSPEGPLRDTEIISFVWMRTHMCTYGEIHCVGRLVFKISVVFFLLGSTTPLGVLSGCQVPVGNMHRKHTSINMPQALHAIPARGCVYRRRLRTD